jgi:serine/threonine protein kinase
MAQWNKLGDPENESELVAIRYLSGHLPDNYTLYTNLEIPYNAKHYEIDIILVAPHGIYVIDVKGISGRLEVDANHWHPENSQSYRSPLKKYRQHARILKGMIKDSDRFQKDDLNKIWVQAAVLLTTDIIVDDVSHEGTEAKDIVILGKPCLKYFQDWQKIGNYFHTNIKPYFSIIDRAIRGRSKARKGPLRFEEWEVLEKLGEKENRYIEYLAKEITIGLSNRTARLRVYYVDPLLDASERQEAHRLIYTAFQAVDDLPPHDNILAVRRIFESDDADSLVLVTADPSGKSLRQHIKKQDLNLEQKLNVFAEVLRALDHAHKHGVIHRNITPENIFVTIEKQVKLTNFDYARIEKRDGTIANFIAEDLDEYSIYQDFDCQKDPTQACQQSDLYSAGQVFYELIMGKTAFEDINQLYEASGIFPLKPSTINPDLPQGFDKWLQKLCAFDRSDRFKNAREALDNLLPLSKVSLDLANLPQGTQLNDQFRIIERLGQPGSFAVAYKVFEIFSKSFQVLKIVIRDDQSLFERVQQEFYILYNMLNYPHPHIVTVRWPGQLREHNNTPFIVFEYLEGKDIEQLLGTFSLEEAVQAVQQTADGLRYLHKKGIYHQDIKPSNLILTEQGIKIIDFNVSVSAADDSPITAGTRRYLPPGFKASIEPTEADRIDRDLYALGITAYQCITGCYPFEEAQPPIGQPCKDPRNGEGFEDLSDELVAFLQRAIAPNRSDRFQSAEDFLNALNSIFTLRKVPAPEPSLEEQVVTEVAHSISQNIAEETTAITDNSLGEEQALDEKEPTLARDIAPLELSVTDTHSITSTEETPIDSPELAEQSVTQASPMSPTESRPEEAEHGESREENLVEPPDPKPSAAPEANSKKTPVKKYKTATSIPLQPAVPSVQQSASVPRFRLFEMRSRKHQLPPNPSKPIVLDPSKAYPVPEGYISINSEVDWMRHFGNGDSPYWVKGQNLCALTEEWLRCWNRSHLIADIKQPPREELAEVLEPISIPDHWTEAQCLTVIMHLESYENKPVARLLADLTGSDPDIWLEAPSVKNLAKWLPLAVPEEAKILEQAWQTQRHDHELSRYYLAQDKQQLLRRWLGLAEPAFHDLGVYPLDIPKSLEEEFDGFWEREFYRTEGKILAVLSLINQPGQKRIAQVAYEVLHKRPAYLVKDWEPKLRPYLSHQKYETLKQRHRPSEPKLLSLEASPQKALRWATESYLPLRRWETVIDQTPQEKRVSDRLASSFEDWMLNHYPSLKVDAVASSWLNFNVSHQVQELCNEAPVLWVVIDGLGWLDHQTLLNYLTERNRLQIERGLQPKFSILPTKTEYAKWSLYSQLLPGHESWEPDAGKGFTMANGKRYTDNDVTKSRLQNDLKQQKYILYCWDSDRFDALHHKEVDWIELYTVKRLRELRDLADDILRFIDMHPRKDEMRVAIASDHGQLMGTSSKLAYVPDGLIPKGRMAIGRADDPSFAVLDKARFDLQHDISVIRGSSSFSSFTYADDKSIIGCHGGLYPEEIVIGFSVLKRSVKRAPIIVTCSGGGKTYESGILTVTIHNPNALSLQELQLTVQEIDLLENGYRLPGFIEANACQIIEINIPHWPELPPSLSGSNLFLTGQLEFIFQNAEAGLAQLDKQSAIQINQIFSSGIEGLDDFF